MCSPWSPPMPSSCSAAVAFSRSRFLKSGSVHARATAFAPPLGQGRGEHESLVNVLDRARHAADVTGTTGVPLRVHTAHANARPARKAGAPLAARGRSTRANRLGEALRERRIRAFGNR